MQVLEVQQKRKRRGPSTDTAASLSHGPTSTSRRFSITARVCASMSSGSFPGASGGESTAARQLDRILERTFPSALSFHARRLYERYPRGKFSAASFRNCRRLLFRDTGSGPPGSMCRWPAKWQVSINSVSAALEAVEATFRADGKIGPRANLDSFENWDNIALLAQKN